MVPWLHHKPVEVSQVGMDILIVGRGHLSEDNGGCQVSIAQFPTGVWLMGGVAATISLLL